MSILMGFSFGQVLRKGCEFRELILYLVFAVIKTTRYRFLALWAKKTKTWGCYPDSQAPLEWYVRSRVGEQQVSKLVRCGWWDKAGRRVIIV